MMQRLEHRGPTARCSAADGPAARGSAGALLEGTVPLAPSLQRVAAAALSGAGRLDPGRVASLGPWRDQAALGQLRAALPPSLAPSLRESFEWYACRGACYHTDAHYADVLFGAWCVLGPSRELVFARLKTRVDATPGALCVFDPFEPHAVLETNQWIYAREHYEDSAASVFLGFELALSMEVAVFFGIGRAPDAGPRLSSRVRVNAESGAIE